MTTKYDDAVIALYQAPLDKFVAERKRLASELKAAGDKAGATRLAGLARPRISAWVVNQLFWEERATFDELFAAGERLRAGDVAGTAARREAMAKLRARAEALLSAAGHAGTEATLRRITTDLSALAAVGSFNPDPPGALAGDREPPGFDALDAAAFEGAPRVESARPQPDRAAVANAHRKKEADAARERQERERLEVERRKAEEERAKKRAERERLSAELHRAKGELKERAKLVERLRGELADAEKSLEETQSEIADLESRRARLE